MVGGASVAIFSLGSAYVSGGTASPLAAVGFGYGVDQMRVGFSEMVYGSKEKTIVETGVSSILQAVGVSENVADKIGTVADVATGLVLTNGVDLMKVGGLGKTAAPLASTSEAAAKEVGSIQKLSKVEKTKNVESIGGKYTKTTEVRPGKGPGQSRSEYVRYKNSEGKVIRTYKDSYDRANQFQHRKPLRGGPEGRTQ